MPSGLGQDSAPKIERRSENIRSTGGPYFDQIVADREEETLHLEFKTLSHDGGKLTRDDRRLIAEAVTGLANAEGGILVIGIKTQKADGIDVAIAKQSIKQLQRTTNLIRAALPEMLSPQHTGINVFPVEELGRQDEGFIVIDVPESLDRPHYSNTHHQYFRRGSDRTRVMEHGEVRDLMFAMREGQLNCVLRFRPLLNTGDLKYAFTLTLTLENVGRVPVKSPYIRVEKAAGWSSSPEVQPRQAANGTSGFDPSPGTIIHIQDELGLAYVETGLDFRWTGRHYLEDAIDVVKRDSKSVVMVPYRDMVTKEGRMDDQPVRVSGFYGAENVPMKTFEFSVDKAALLAMFCKDQSVDW